MQEMTSSLRRRGGLDGEQSDGELMRNNSRVPLLVVSAAITSREKARALDAGVEDASLFEGEELPDSDEEDAEDDSDDEVRVQPSPSPSPNPSEVPAPLRVLARRTRGRRGR